MILRLWWVTWETVRKARQGVSKLLRVPSSNRWPNSCVPSNANVNTRRNKMDKSEKMERMALVSDRTRLPSARQYLMTHKWACTQSFAFNQWIMLKRTHMIMRHAKLIKFLGFDRLTLWLWRHAGDGRNVAQTRRVVAWRSSWWEPLPWYCWWQRSSRIGWRATQSNPTR